MAFKTVSSLDADNTVSLGKRDKKTGKLGPNSAEGYYLGNRVVQTNLGPSTLHFLQTPKGNLGVWGSTDMNRKLGAVDAGTMVRITAAGERPSKKGNPMKVFTVEFDTENTIEVQVSASQPAEDVNNNDTGYGTDGSGGDGSEDESTEDYEAPAYNPPPKTQQLSAAERKAKVDALLKGNRK